MKIIDDPTLPRDTVFVVDTPIGDETIVSFNSGYNHKDYLEEISSAVKACERMARKFGLASTMAVRVR